MTTDSTQCDVNSTGYCETHDCEYYKCHSVTQELDEILAANGRSINDGDFAEAKQAILDWHNKQIEEVIGEYEKLGLPTTQAQEQSNYDKRVRNAMRDWQRETAGLPTRYDSYKLKEGK